MMREILTTRKTNEKFNKKKHEFFFNLKFFSFFAMQYLNMKHPILLLLYILSITFCSNAHSQTLKTLYKVGDGNVNPRDAVYDNSGNYYVLGDFSGVVDFSTNGGGAFMISTTSQPDIFIAKYNVETGFVNAIQLAGSGNDVGISIAIDDSSNLYITGWFRNAIDFDPTTNAGMVMSSGDAGIDYGYNGEAFLAKYDNNLRYKWGFALGGGTINDCGVKVRVDQSQKIWVSGLFFGTVDFDPSSNITSRTSSSGTHGFLAKYDTNGGLLGVVSLGNGATSDAGVRDFNFDVDGNVYLMGYYFGGMDLNPGSGINNVSSSGSGDVFIVKLNSQLNYIWGKALQGSSLESPWALVVDDSSNVYIGGSSMSSALTLSGLNTNFRRNLSSQSQNSFVLKIDRDGNFKYTQAIASLGDNSIYDLLLLNNSLFFTGSAKRQISFSNSSITLPSNTSGSNSINSDTSYVFLAQLNKSTGDLISAFKVNRTTNLNGNDIAYSLHANPANNEILIAGTIGRGISDFDPSNNSRVLATTNKCGFIASYTYENILSADRLFLTGRLLGKYAEFDINLYDSKLKNINFETSNNNIDFKSEASLLQAGQHSSLTHYYDFSQATKDKMYFRIKGLSNGNRIIYSNTIVLSYKHAAEFSILPNIISNSECIINYSSNSQNRGSRLIRFSVFNENGSLISNGTFSMIGNSGLHRISLPNMSSGKYYVQIFSDDIHVSTISFLKV